jgi:hypothetical protein
MTEQYIDRANLLRTRLINALGNLLGTYTTLAGQTLPAILIDDAGTPRGMRVTGLEVSIQPEINSTIIPMLGSNQLNFETVVTLKQWDLTTTTIAATEAILLGIDEVVRVGARVPRNTILDNIETREIGIMLPRIQRVYRTAT